MVQEVGGGGEGLRPVGGREGGLEQKTTEHVVCGADHTLSPTILRRGVGAGESELNAVREEKGARGRVIELPAVVALNRANRTTELGGDPSEEVQEGGEGVRLETQRKSPQKVGEVIKNQQIVLKAGEAGDRRGPEVAVDKIERLGGSGGGMGEGKASVATQLASVTQGNRTGSTTRNDGAGRQLGQNIVARMAESTVLGSG